ncbi:hypothetical protein BDV29DRAFT_152590 [Aspergillus leporis]|uniref:UDP-Glycosyltransferase/glycogen phosphorylase n=1 Tax=Aspergillus leporis TaxID=41062 RepID=A0A5N5XD56_9EURO|nr:hypothetical protein BDV29DRAFT_152590 [Aspergillus leporis]
MSGDCRHVWRILNNPNVFLADSVPHEWLLTRAAVIVHHGSIETTALALEYEKPSILIPCQGDQLVWATTLVVNTVAYGVKSIKVIKTQDKKEQAAGLLPLYDFPDDSGPYPSSSRPPQLPPTTSQESLVKIRATEERQRTGLNSRQKNVDQSGGVTPSASRHALVKQVQSRDERHVEAICRRHLERGLKNPKVQDPGFKEMVRSRFQDLCDENR